MNWILERRPRFSLRGLMLLMTLFGISLSMRLNQVRRADDALKAIRETDLAVQHEVDRTARLFKCLPLPSTLRNSLIRNLSVRRVTTIRSVGYTRYGAKNLTDELLAQLDVTILKEVSLVDTEVTAEGLAFLKGSSIEQLSFGYYLDKKSVADDGEGLRRVSELDSLESLSLINVPLGADRYSFLLGLDNLKNLGLHNQNLIPQDLEVIAQLPALESLDLTESPVDSDGLLYLLKSKKLTNLSLMPRRIRLTEDGMAFESTTNQKELSELGQLSNLKSLRLGVVSSPDLERLKNSLPGCRVTGICPTIIP